MFCLILSLDAANHIQFSHAAKICPGYGMTVASDDGIENGVRLTLAYERQLPKVAFQFEFTPSYYFSSEDHFYNTTIHNIEVDSFTTLSYDMRIETALLISLKPTGYVSGKNKSFTCNFWKIGAVFEGTILGKRIVESGFIHEEREYSSRRFWVGFIYKPEIGFQITDKFNLGFATNYSLNFTPMEWFPMPKISTQLVFKFSDPVKKRVDQD